ncbi:hypothetical protein DENIS_2302 [Desulfonema ishimotonii]|uniref:Right handed beta helix domain-containing protein n=1 Tax=Desulfonema ishimotonii TaxID=45657 RepID=A0A401FWG2_9BACT|nr:LamG-like jellyroll fold domain-containing protein [Desulfonema ishimotonii]GBC61342.1 hypothetical protein DENIS_2302 [Desulfonema ishimotonii]
MHAKKGFGEKALLLLTTLLILAALAVAAEAKKVNCGKKVRCGDVITRNAVLDRDLNCSEDPALTVVGPANLNMRGFTVSNTGGKSHDGIWLKGCGGHLHNGTVTGFGKGVLIGGDGGHHIHHVKVTEHTIHGFSLESPNNRLRHNMSGGNFGNGIWLSEKADNNLILKNTFNSNGASGIRLKRGEIDFVEAVSESAVSGESGIRLAERSIGLDNAVLENTAAAVSDTISDDGAASSNVITMNTVVENSVFDVLDETATCGDNDLTGNDVGSTSDPCNVVVGPTGASDPILHWEFEGSGDVVIDSSGNGNEAPINAGQRVADAERGGSVLYADGSAFTIATASSPNGFDVSLPFSVSFWLKPAHFENYNQHIGPGWGQFRFYSNEDGGMHVGIVDTERFKPTLLNETLELDKWQMLTYTFSYGEARFYRNGQLIYGAGSITAPQQWDNFQLFKINGLLDDVRVYNCALSAAEVGILYGGQGSDNEFVLHWEFEESGDTIVDSSGNENHAPVKDGIFVADPDRGQVLYATGSHRAMATDSAVKGMNVSLPFTVAFWLKPELLDEPYTQRIGTNWGEFMFMTGTESSMQVGTDGDSRFSSSTLRQKLALNEWQLLAFVYDSGKARFYRNGRIIGEKGGGVAAPQLWGQFELAKIRGWVDDVRVYNRTLTSAEIREIFGGDLQPDGGPYFLDDENYEVTEIWSGKVHPGDNDPGIEGAEAGYNIMKHRELVTVYGDYYYVLYIYEGGRPRVMKIAMDDLSVVQEAFIEPDDYHARPDSHHYFTMEVDKNGYLHVVGDMHLYPRHYNPNEPNSQDHLPERLINQKCLYWRTASPEDVTTFAFMGGSEDTAPKGIGFTYPHFFKDNNNELYLINRLDIGHRYSGENKKGVGVTRYDAATGSWAALGDYPYEDALAKMVFWEKFQEPGDSEDGYTKVWPYMTFDRQNRMHIAANLLDDGETDYRALGQENGVGDVGHYTTDAVYLRSDDGGDTFVRTDGTPVNLPARILDEGDGKQGDIAYDCNGVDPHYYLLNVANYIATDYLDRPIVGLNRRPFVQGLDTGMMIVRHDGTTWNQYEEIGNDEGVNQTVNGIYSDHEGVITFLGGLGHSKIRRFWRPDGLFREYSLKYLDYEPFAFNPNYVRTTGDLLGYSYDEDSETFHAFHIRVTRPE